MFCYVVHPWLTIQIWEIRSRIYGFFSTLTGSPYAIRPLSVLSATLVYCGQTVRWIKMKVDTMVGFGPGHIVLDGDLAPPKKDTAPNFRHMSVVTKRLVWMD